jgi:hypothetical protein
MTDMSNSIREAKDDQSDQYSSRHGNRWRTVPVPQRLEARPMSHRIGLTAVTRPIRKNWWEHSRRTGFYEDVAFGITKKGSAELRELHKFFHNAVGGLYVKLIDTHVTDGHGTIEWVFGGTDVDVFKTGKPFSVRGVSVIEVSDGHISRNLDYYYSAAIMRQVGVLPKP